MSNETVAGTPAIPRLFPAPPGNLNWSTTDTFVREIVKVLSVIFTASSGICKIQKRPFEPTPGLKSCSCDVKLTSQRSIHISTNVPRVKLDLLCPAPPLGTAPTYCP